MRWKAADARQPVDFLVPESTGETGAVDLKRRVLGPEHRDTLYAIN
jgi:hypothetical protein